MDMALDYVGLAATTGLNAYVLAQLLSGSSANRQLYHGMTTAMAVGIAQFFHIIKRVVKT